MDDKGQGTDKRALPFLPLLAFPLSDNPTTEKPTSENPTQ
jgi:hypothetical protein